MYSKELLKGTLKTILLKMLSEHGRMYGYELTQKVKELSQEKISLTEGALYPMLHKMEAENLVTTETEIVNGRKRKYYAVTNVGNAEAQSKSTEFVEFVQTILLLLNPQLTKK
ncbi:MAG: PadR family transcriptional regulator [Reichenbachiella sp.]